MRSNLVHEGHTAAAVSAAGAAAGAEAAAPEGKRGIGLGVFDGCHLGHMELLGRLADRSAELGLRTAAYTFCTHPSHVTGDRDRISGGLITTEAEKESLILGRGIDGIIYREFTEEFARREPLDFLENELKKEWNASLIVVGFNFRFGRDRKGNTELLRKWGAENGIEVDVIEPILYKGKPVSSSRIRSLIQSGRMEEAAAMLGRRHSLSGEIVSGQKLGAKLGFPTANFHPDSDACLPKNGVYATRLTVGDRCYDAVTNIGLRPSVPGRSPHPIAETMVLDAAIDLYGKTVKLEFLHRIRDEKLFPGLDELREAIAADVAAARRYHGSAEDYHLLAQAGGIRLSGLKSSRFTTDLLTISMRVPLDRQTASDGSLLSRVLTATGSAYPTRTGLAEKLDSMYGAQIDCTTEIQGDSFLLHFQADALHSWRGEESPFAEAVELLFDMLENPDYPGGGNFRDEIVESEKTGLLSEIAARENDKGQYAFDRCLQIYAGDSVYAVRSFGDAGMIRSANGASLRAAYRDLVRDARITVSIGGRFGESDVEKILKMIRSAFPDNDPKTETIPGRYPKPFAADVPLCSVTERKDVEQSRICRIYRGMPSYRSLEMPVCVLLNTLLGGDVDSLLFRHVREEQGLAYSVFSALLKFMSALFMEAGVAHENTEKALQSMEDQVEAARRGDIDEKMLSSAVKSVTFAYREISDSLRGLLRYAINGEISGMRLSPDSAIAITESITAGQIRDMARRLEPAVTYVLTGAGEDGADGI